MKSERKQVLESNLLADKIEAIFVRVKTLLPVILVVIGVVIVGLLTYGFYSSYQENRAAKAWTDFYFSDTDTAELNSVSEQHGSTAAGLYAKQTAGDAYMAKALEKVYFDRDLSDQYYKQAIDEYKAVSEKTADPFLKERSLYGLAQAYEGLSDREQAIANYRKVTALPDLPPEFLAEIIKRIAWLESKSGEQFYTWFKQTRPSAPVLNQGDPAKSPVPAIPNIDFPPVPKSESKNSPSGNVPTETEAVATPVTEPKVNSETGAPAAANNAPAAPTLSSEPNASSSSAPQPAPAELPK